MSPTATIAGLIGIITTLCTVIGVLFLALREAQKRADVKHDAELQRFAAQNLALEAQGEKMRLFYVEQATISVRNVEAQNSVAAALLRQSDAFDRMRSGTHPAVRPR